MKHSFYIAVRIFYLKIEWYIYLFSILQLYIFMLDVATFHMMGMFGEIT
jgi:hypothetical protein